MARFVEPTRPDPESFLRAASREEKRGRLKIYLGMAAGVGDRKSVV
jgi:K+-sensing histidine kinase KdpD